MLLSRQALKSNKGFSLIELSVVISVLAILLAVGLPKFDAYVDRGRRAQAYGDIAAISSAVAQYKLYMGSYPTNQAALRDASPFDNRPWIPALPSKDPWGTANSGIDGTGGNGAYCYSFTANGFAVWSLGKNKVNNSGGSGTTLPNAFAGDDPGVLGQ